MRPRWWDFAACKGMNPEDFVDYTKIDQCLAICATCPVVDDCREDAESTVSTTGVRGGKVYLLSLMENVDQKHGGILKCLRCNCDKCLAARDKYELRVVKGNPISPRKPCGTSAYGYEAHRKRGEPACSLCLTRLYEYREAWKAAKNGAN